MGTGRVWSFLTVLRKELKSSTDQRKRSWKLALVRGVSAAASSEGGPTLLRFNFTQLNKKMYINEVA